MEGWIKLHRKINIWEWKTKPNTFCLFIHLLTIVNHKEGKWRGIDIPKGSVITGRKQLSRETGLSERSIRTALTHLKSTNEVTIESTNDYSIITITNWKNYQATDQPEANGRPATDQRPTTNKNDNNDKNDKEDKKFSGVAAREPVSSRLEVWLERNGFDGIPEDWGWWAHKEAFMSDTDINKQWESFVDYWKGVGGAKGKKADWQATWRNWCRRSQEKK